MALTLKYQGRQRERNDNGFTTTMVWTGTQEECEAFAAEAAPGDPGEEGTLDSVRIYQDGGNIWAVERRYTTDRDGNFTNKPNVVYGRKSAQLHCGMLSLPIERNKNYKTHWNYYLAAAPSVTSVPEWWETAKNTIMTNADAQKYRWVLNPSECPQDKNGMWRTIKDPKYKGLSSYDLATYTITETAKFSSAKKAGQMIAGKLNQIGKPEEDFGLTPSGYNWKCDSAEVSYNGGDWYAHLTWTRSGDDQGWIPEIYGGLS